MKIRSQFILLALLVQLLLVSETSFAVGRGGGTGGFSIATNVGFINAEQKDMNKEIDARGATTSANNFGNAWEFNANFSYRMSGGSMALGLRPSYFYYPEESGTGAKYNLSGYTVFPTLKWFMLEDTTIKFYSQFGLGYGHMSGEIKDNGLDVKFSGGDLGYMAGLGAEFCFTPSHCINVEGNMRFMSIDQMNVDSVSGTAPTGSRITQILDGKEFEIDGRDFSATMSGILGMVGYTMHF